MRLTMIPDAAVVLSSPGYESLAAILEEAFAQASAGKGKERHANDAPFDSQAMQYIIGAHGVGFALGQADKKMRESYNLSHVAAVRELLGAIVYIAGAIIAMRRGADESESAGPVPVPSPAPELKLQPEPQPENPAPVDPAREIARRIAESVMANRAPTGFETADQLACQCDGCRYARERTRKVLH